MGTSQLQSKFNRIHRDLTDDNKDLLTSIKKELKRDYINDLIKQKNDFKKMIKMLMR
jgi:flagellar hook-associated protein FlgK